MPSPITISIRVQPYLVDFITSLFGPQPISFPRKHNFNRMLNLFLEKEQPAFSNYRRGETNLEIQLPYFEDKNVLSNFSISPVQERVLVSKMEDLFKLTFRDEMDQWLLLGVTKIEAIHLFIDKHQLKEDSVDMLLKDYQRFRDCKYKKKASLKKKKILSVKSAFCPVVPITSDNSVLQANSK